MRYQIGVANANVTAGIGPALIVADNPEQAKERFAAAEGTTVDKLAATGLTWWNIAEQPEEPTEPTPEPTA